MLSLLVIDPNTVFSAFMWTMLTFGFGVAAWVIYQTNKSTKGKRIIHRNDLWERHI